MRKGARRPRAASAGAGACSRPSRRCRRWRLCLAGSASTVAASVLAVAVAFLVLTAIERTESALAAAAAAAAAAASYQHARPRNRGVNSAMILPACRRSPPPTVSLSPAEEDPAARQRHGPATAAGWGVSGAPFPAIPSAAIVTAAAALALAVTLPAPALAAAADPRGSNDFFRRAGSGGSWLTSPVLEQVRIWDQEVADNNKYGGELERGDAARANALRRDAYPRLLFPLLRIERDLEGLGQTLLLEEGGAAAAAAAAVGPSEWRHALAVVSSPMYDTQSLKAAFNRYGDNIYYRDADRANLYLGGGAVPESDQTLAYLLRNDFLTSVQSLRSELEYCLKEGETSSTGSDGGANDVALYASQAREALGRYLDLVPPEQLGRARELLQQEEAAAAAGGGQEQ